MVVKVAPSAMVWSGYISDHRRIVDRGYGKGAPHRMPDSRPGSVARERDGLRAVPVGIRYGDRGYPGRDDTVSAVLPEYVQVISASVLSTSVT